MGARTRPRTALERGISRAGKAGERGDLAEPIVERAQRCQRVRGPPEEPRTSEVRHLARSLAVRLDDGGRRGRDSRRLPGRSRLQSDGRVRRVALALLRSSRGARLVALLLPRAGRLLPRSLETADERSKGLLVRLSIERAFPSSDRDDVVRAGE